MKKILLLVPSMLLLVNVYKAQEDDFDKKFRFGLRVSPQPTWIASKDNFTSRSGAGFGFGFGLVTEFKLSDIIHFQTGIGGDFESGSIKYKNGYNTPSGAFAAYTMDGDNELVEAKDKSQLSDYNSSANKTYVLTERKIKATYVTIPLILKMMTKEIGGFRYFGMFGGELGIRTKLRSDDSYSNVFFTNGMGTMGGSGTNTNVNISKDGSLIPMRVGLNVGAGAEYRLGGSTSLFLNVNFFHSFTNTFRKESKFVVQGDDTNIYTSSSTPSSLDFKNLKQDLLQNAIRINIGVMF